jgi:predicted DNA binding CopG/RHH family protein
MSGKYTEAQKKATIKYLKQTVSIQIRVTEAKREEYREKAQKAGKSLSQYIIDLLENA